MPDQLIRVLTVESEVRAALSRTRGFAEPELSPNAKAGVKRIFGEDLSADQVVDLILRRVRTEGDAGVAALTAAIDGQAPVSPRSSGHGVGRCLRPDFS